MVCARPAGYEEQKRAMEDTLLLALRHPEVYADIARGTRARYASNRPRAILFEGPPGCGKTTSARRARRPHPDRPRVPRVVPRCCVTSQLMPWIKDEVVIFFSLGGGQHEPPAGPRNRTWCQQSACLRHGSTVVFAGILMCKTCAG